MFVREELLAPLEIEDIYVGLPDTHLNRVAPVLIPGPPAPAELEIYEASMPVAVAPGTIFNRTDVRRSINPGCRGHHERARHRAAVRAPGPPR